MLLRGSSATWLSSVDNIKRKTVTLHETKTAL